MSQKDYTPQGRILELPGASGNASLRELVLLILFSLVQEYQARKGNLLYPFLLLWNQVPTLQQPSPLVNKIVGAQTLQRAKMIRFLLRHNIRKWATGIMWSQKWRGCESLTQAFTYYSRIGENQSVGCLAYIKPSPVCLCKPLCLPSFAECDPWKHQSHHLTWGERSYRG